MLSAFVAALLGAVALRAVITHLFWGTWLTTPHARLGSGMAAAGALEALTRMLGWLFDQEHGLLLYAPIYLLAPLGAVVLWKRQRPLCAQLLLVIGVYVIVMALPWFNPHGWRGGWNPAGRFLLPIIPLAAILVFAGVAAFEKTPVWMRVLVAVQLVVNATVWQNPKLLWNEGDGRSALLEFVAGGGVDWPRYAPSLPWRRRRCSPSLRWRPRVSPG